MSGQFLQKHFPSRLRFETIFNALPVLPDSFPLL
jgi:hypothetical protein